MGQRASARDNRRTYALHGALILLIVAQFATLLWLIWRRTPHVPMADEWELVNFFELADQGRLDLSIFWSFQNEHRIFLPRLLLYGLIAATGWQRQVIMAINLGIALGTFALTFAAARRTVGARAAALLGIPLALLLFSFAQFENWLFAFQTNFILAGFGIALALWGLLPRADRAAADRAFAVAIAGALVASLSTLAGLLTWVAFIPAVWWRGWRRLAIWCAAALAIGIPYFNGFPGHAGGAPNLGAIAIYAVAYLGAPLGAQSVPLATAYGLLGLILLVLVAILIWRREWLDAQTSTWLGLVLLGLGSMILTTAGRAGLGADQALASRYQSFSTLLWVGLLALAALFLKRAAPHHTGRSRTEVAPPSRMQQSLGMLLAVILGAGLLRANAAGLYAGRDWLDYRRDNEGCIRQYDTAPDECLTYFYPVADLVRIHAAFLEQHRLGIFRETSTTPNFAAPPRAGAARANIDLIGAAAKGTVTIAADQPLSVSGWALDGTAHQPAVAVYLLLDGRHTYRADYGATRPDVARAVGLSGNDHVGFNATLPPGMATSGREHTLAVRVITADGTAYADSPTLATFRVAATAP